MYRALKSLSFYLWGFIRGFGQIDEVIIKFMLTVALVAVLRKEERRRRAGTKETICNNLAKYSDLNQGG